MKEKQACTELATVATSIVPKPTKRQILEATATALFHDLQKKADAADKERERILERRNAAIKREAKKIMKTGRVSVGASWGQRDEFTVETSVQVKRTPEINELDAQYKAVPTIKRKSIMDFYKDLVEAAKRPNIPAFAVDNPKITKQLLEIGQKLLQKLDTSKPSITV